MDLDNKLITLANKCLTQDLNSEENIYPLKDGNYYKIYKKESHRHLNNADFICHCSYHGTISPEFTDFRIIDSHWLIVVQSNNFKIYSSDRSTYETFYTNDEYFNIILNYNAKINFSTLSELQKILNKSTISTLSFYVMDM